MQDKHNLAAQMANISVMGKKNNIIENINLTPDEPEFDCLKKCLDIIIKMEQKSIDITSLTQGLPIQEFMSAEIFCRSMAKADISANIIAIKLKKITAMHLPVVLLLKNNKAVILTKLQAKKSTVILPESGGIQQIPTDYLEKHYTGEAVFYKSAIPYDERLDHDLYQRPKRWFFDVIKKTWPIYTEVMIASIFINLFAIVGSLFSMNVYDRVVPNAAYATLHALAFGIIIIYVFDLILGLLRSIFIDAANKKTDVELHNIIFHHMLGIKLAHKPAAVGNFSSNLNQFEAFRDFFTSTSLITFIDLPFTIIILGFMYSITGSLVLVPLCIIPTMIISTLIIQYFMKPKIKESSKYSSQKQVMLIEYLTGLEQIKSLAAESFIQKKWENITSTSAKINGEVKTLTSTANSLSGFFTKLNSVLIIIFGVYLIGDGQMTMGALIAANILSSRILSPFQQISSLICRLEQATTSLQSMDKIMQVPSEHDDATNLTRPYLNGKIEVKNLSFQYPNEDVKIFDDISFCINPGEHVAIIGKIGSGKSTLQKLLMNFYQPDNGMILFDNHQMQQLSSNFTRKNIGYVPQDIMLFHGSLKENLSFGFPYATDDKILKIIELANLQNFIQNHPKGLEMIIGERGQKLSGGQKQSIALARAFLLDPPILLLDEPTNMMDNQTESIMVNNIQQQSKHKTILMITHKPKMLDLVDRIIWLENGKIKADGPKSVVLATMNKGI